MGYTGTHDSTFNGNFLGYDINGYYAPKQNINLLFFKVQKLGIESKVLLDNNKKFPKLSGIIKSKFLNET